MAANQDGREVHRARPSDVIGGSGRRAEQLGRILERQGGKRLSEVALRPIDPHMAGDEDGLHGSPCGKAPLSLEQFEEALPVWKAGVRVAAPNVADALPQSSQLGPAAHVLPLVAEQAGRHPQQHEVIRAVGPGAGVKRA